MIKPLETASGSALNITIHHQNNDRKQIYKTLVSFIFQTKRHKNKWNENNERKMIPPFIVWISRSSKFLYKGCRQATSLVYNRYSLRGKTSYHKISWSLGSARLDGGLFVLPCNLTSGKPKISKPKISLHRDFTRLMMAVTEWASWSPHWLAPGNGRG